VPVFPGWVSRGGWIPLVGIGAVLLVICVDTGTSYGAPDGWSLLLALALPTAAWLWSSFARRAEELKLRKHLELQARIKIKEVDHLSWQEFEVYCIILLQLLGYRNVRKTRNLPQVKAVDITAIAPSRDSREIFECKHRKLRPIGVREVNELIGRIASGMYKGLPVTLVTNARITDGAHHKAAQHGITVMGREQLAGLIAQATGQPGNPASARPAPGSHDEGATAGAWGLIVTWFKSLRSETKLAITVTGAGSLVVLIIVLQMAVASPRAAAVPAGTPRPHSAIAKGSAATHPSAKASTTGNVTAPEAVARQYFSAISAHDWPQVWRLGGQNIGRGPYASYEGMVAGYRDTIRDAPMTMTVKGSTVFGRFLAYETGDRVQTYTFSYVIRHGAIASASQEVVATSS
jgi:hypothetical protein